LVLCGAAEKLAKLSLYALQLTSSRRVTAQTNAFVEQSKQFGGIVGTVVVFASLTHIESATEAASINRP
jgi:hypothetical protein